MPSLWDPSLSTGIPSIDAEHEQLIERVYCVLEHDTQGNVLATTHDLVVYLEQHALNHFMEEEETMRLRSYPQIVPHRVEHNRLMDFVLHLRRRLWTTGRDQDILVAEGRMLCTWMLSHVQGTDRELAAFLKRQPRLVL